MTSQIIHSYWKLILFFVLSVFSLSIFSKNQSTYEFKNFDKNFKASSSLTWATNAYVLGNTDDQQSVSWSFKLAYQLPRNWGLSVGAGIINDYSGERETNLLGDPKINLSYQGWKLFNNTITVAPVLSTYLTVSNVSRQITSLDSQFTLTTAVILNTKKINIPNSFISYASVFHIKNYKYDTNAYGSSNANYSWIHNLGLGYTFFKKLSLSVNGAFISNFLYGGEITNIYSLSESISYQMSPKISISVNHSNDANYLKDDGQTNNLALYRDRTSQYSINLSLKL